MAIRAAILGSSVVAFAQVNAVTEHFAAVMPLGSDSILLQPAKQRLNMLMTVECPEMGKIFVKGTGQDRAAIDPDGNPVRFYPSEVSFRFTIGARTGSEETSPNEFKTKDTADHFQSTLHFRLKVFHGMSSKTLEPVEARMIGVPADMPYDERIYHLTFKLKNIPVEDRMMLEVLDTQGRRVGKFHLQIL